MGTWGPGNFDNDAAQDTRDQMIDEISDQIQTCLNFNRDLDEGGESEFMPLIEILTVLCERCGAHPPEVDVVTKWRNQYLQTFDEQIDGFQPKPEFKEARRKVIRETFDKLEKLADEWHKRVELL